MDILLSTITFFDNIIVQSLLAFPLLLSMVVSYRFLNVPDVTMDGSSILGAAVCVLLMREMNVGWPVALAISVVAGFLAGLLTGILIEILKINSLLAGILNGFLLYSISLLMIGAALDFETGTTIFSWLKEKDRVLSLRLPTGVIVHPYVMLFLLSVAFILKICLDWFLRREWGVVLRGTSTNEFFLQLRGVNTKRVRILAFGLANALVGLGATLISMYDGSVQIMRWPGTIIFALSVSIVGWEACGQLLKKFHIELNETSAVIIGALIYYFIVRVCYTYNVPTALPRLLIALYIILVLAEQKGLWRRTHELFR